ncbi:hypothetical protein IJH72_00155 [Candidatus Saccharibacteria bacterium]|nr:hypothetical protein [Candidatus Saccharibacteria bacterium]MBQ2638036.1 hypothetical protein [Candidatus Saccharibacteria bacterium]MBQ3320647.1 hypothetical protein [Candidatus Saccharibacteria bacterium]MBR0372346.1 hypothetical protein [Candidatus Saccharibacteria bacterium]
MKTILDIEKIRKELKIDAKAVGIPSGASKSFIDETLKGMEKTLKGKKVITDNDLKRAIVKELKKYNSDLAYVYENRDKII